MYLMANVGLHLLGCSYKIILQAALSAARSCSSTPIHASACCNYANNPPFAFLLPVFLEVEAVASVVFSKVYRSAICSMLVFLFFVIETNWLQRDE